MAYTVLALDPSLSNVGYVVARVNQIRFPYLLPISSGLVTTHSKQDLYTRASDIVTAIRNFVLSFEVSTVVAEMPYGSQSYMAAVGMGVVFGVLASLDVGVDFVSPDDVKKVVVAATGIQRPKKGDMLYWAITKYPKLEWPKTKEGKVFQYAHHIADAAAVLTAWGIKQKSDEQEIAEYPYPEPGTHTAG